MGPSEKLIHALKQTLKSRGISYRTLAKELGISEASVKRVFAERTFTLDRLEQICKVLGVSFLELARAAEGRDTEEQTTLNEAQELELARDPRLFTFLYVMLSGSSPAQIVKHYEFTEQESERILLRLDKLGLIELHPGSRVRLLVSRNVRWLPSGPLIQRYDREIKKEFLNSEFTGINERLRFLSGRLSRGSLRVLSKKIDKIIADFKEVSEMDDGTPEREKEGMWFLVAYRPWTFSVVSKLKRSHS